MIIRSMSRLWLRLSAILSALVCASSATDSDPLVSHLLKRSVFRKFMTERIYEVSEGSGSSVYEDLQVLRGDPSSEALRIALLDSVSLSPSSLECSTSALANLVFALQFRVGRRVAATTEVKILMSRFSEKVRVEMLQATSSLAEALDVDLPSSNFLSKAVHLSDALQDVNIFATLASSVASYCDISDLHAALKQAVGILYKQLTLPVAFERAVAQYLLAVMPTVAGRLKRSLVFKTVFDLIKNSIANNNQYHLTSANAVEFKQLLVLMDAETQNNVLFREALQPLFTAASK